MARRRRNLDGGLGFLVVVAVALVWNFVTNYWEWILIFLGVGVSALLLYKVLTERHKNRMLNQAGPRLEQFVKAYLRSDKKWPDTPNTPSDDIVALGTILQRDGITLPTDVLRRAVTQELTRKIDEHFEKAFVAEHRFTGKPTASDLASAYVDTFANNMDYVPYLERFATNRAWSNGLALRAAVEGEIQARAHQRRVAVVEEALQGKRVPARPSIADVDVMPGEEFEHLLGRLFSAMGYAVEVTPLSGDQGADVILEKFGERTAVQAKRYSEPVSNKAIQEVVAAKKFYRCDQGMVVTNSNFTTSATELARANGVALWGREKLEEMIRLYL